MGARNWKVAESFEVLKGGDNSRAAERRDIGMRFPLVSTATYEEIMASFETVPLRFIENRLRAYHGMVPAKVEEGESPAEESAEGEPVEEAPTEEAPKPLTKAEKKAAKAAAAKS